MFEFLMGGTMQAAGALMQADSDSKGMLMEAEAQDRNAKIARIAGDYNISRQQQQAYKVIGGVKADYGASGVTSDSGSVMDVIRESHVNAELDRMNIQYATDLRILEAKSRATELRQAAGRAKQMGKFNAFSALFGAAAMGGMKGSGDPAPKPATGGSTSGYSGYGSAGGNYNDYGSMA